MATMSFHEIYFPSNGCGEDVFAPIESHHQSPDWQSCPNTAQDFDEWLQETFGDEENEQGFGNSRSAAPQKDLLSYGQSSMSPEYVAKVVSKLDLNIERLQKIKNAILKDSSSRVQKNEPSLQVSTREVENKEIKAAPIPMAAPVVVPVSPLSSKKRKRPSWDVSSIHDAANSESDSSVGGGDKELQKVNRREQNRVSAKKCRQKKKKIMDELKSGLEYLKEENKKLHEFVASKLGQNQAKSLVQQEIAKATLEDDQKKKDSSEQSSTFLNNLQSSPSSRFVDSDTLEFLRTLSEQVAIIQAP